VRRVFTALVGVAAYAGTAWAQPSDACISAEHIVHAQAGLPRVAAAVDHAHQLAISVSGTASSVLPGPSGAGKAYPARLEAALAGRLPGVSVKVINAAKQKQTAAEMAAEFDKLLTDEKPVLVVWQTGTVDAIRGIDPDDFRNALNTGIDKLQAGGADVILMNMQYSPRTDSMIAADVYSENMQGIALEREIPLFDRFAIMKEWNDEGTFDLYAATKNPETAEHVHACIGELLADFVVEAVDLARQPQEEVH
jgi:lysophospholipase L1-like esterase